MYSTSGNRKDWKDCYEAGADRFFIKPVEYGGISKGLTYIFNLFENGGLAAANFEDFVIDTLKMK